MNAAAYLHSWSGAPGARDHGASAALSRWVMAQDVNVQKVFGWLSEQTDQHAAATTIENEAAAQASKKKVRKLTTFRIQEKGPATSLSKNKLWKKRKKGEKQKGTS